MFYDNLHVICNERGTSPTAVCKKLGLSTGLPTAWKRGTVPKIDTVQLIAAHLQVPVSALLDEPAPAPVLEPQAIPGITAEEQEILLGLRKHPEYIPMLRKLLDLPSNDEKSVVS